MLASIRPFIILLGVSTALSYKLPTIYSPSYYRVGLTLPSDVFTKENATEYAGWVEITLTSTQNASEIVLHASETYINVTMVRLVSGNDQIQVLGYNVNGTSDILTVSLASALIPGEEYMLRIDFDAKLSTTDMYGFYKSSYKDSSNTTQYLATTQMEATYARRVFPCFDEPRYKAKFEISLTYPEGLNALGNMKIMNSTNTNGTTTTLFNVTPITPTYLVAFIVSSFTCSEGNSIEGTLPYQVCSRNETVSTRSLALEVAPLVIDSLNRYLNVNYSQNMEKLDQVAIPDFSAGAMENWGLITYRERGILYDQNETSNLFQQSITTVIAHELSHQWFGNLVTCKWWSELFLNEGFATFFEHFTTHEIYPEMELDKQFVVKTLQNIFEEDASSKEALRSNASSASEISERFGSISYDKGGSVLRMVEHILGTEVWKTGLNQYLNDFANSNTEPDDLWRILGSNISVDLPASNLSTIMESWINSPGFPVVNVSLNGSELRFTQERFVFSNTTASNTTWYIPISFTTSQNLSGFEDTRPKHWITPSGSSSVNVSSNVSWIVVNNQQTGYYRVNYDSALWSMLVTALQQPNSSGIPEINRAQIVNDAFNLARAGYITYSQLFDVTKFLANETSYSVWYSAFSGFKYLLDRIGENSTLGQRISKHVIELASTLIQGVPMSSTNASNHIYTLKQVLAQSWACQLGRADSNAEASRLFREYTTSSKRPDKNLRAIVYCHGLKHSSNVSADWEFLWNAFLETSLSTEQVTILSALGCPSHPTILNSYLNKTLTNGSGIRSQDYASVFTAVYKGSPSGVDIALDFFITNLDAIMSRYTSMTGIGDILKGIAEQITTQDQIVKLERLINSNVLNDTMLEAANAALKSVKNNNNWVNTYKSDLYAYYGIEEETAPSSNVSTPIPPTTTTAKAESYKHIVSLSLVISSMVVILL